MTEKEEERPLEKWNTTELIDELDKEGVDTDAIRAELDTRSFPEYYDEWIGNLIGDIDELKEEVSKLNRHDHKDGKVVAEI